MGVENLEYQDTFIVKRIKRDADGSTVTDDNGDVIYDVIHEGVCDYQIVPSSTKIKVDMYATEPTVYFPLVDKFFQQDDIVEVFTHYGRRVDGFIRDYDKVDFRVLRQSIIYLRIVQDGE